MRATARAAGSVVALALLGTFACRPALRVPAAPSSGLAEQVRARIAAQPGALVEVAFIDLAHPSDTLYLNADTPVHAASTMKLPVMMRLYREANGGVLDLDRRIKLVNDFASIVDGSHYALDPKVDGDTALYAVVGDSITVRDLIRHMITRSSNLATNTLIALANPDSVNAMMRGFGATRMRVLRGVEDEKAFDRGFNNMATARDLATLLAALETGRAAPASATSEMRGILLAQEFNEKIPAGLPPGTPVAHKTGDITAIAHDAAIVYPRGRLPYVLVVLTKGIAQQATADALIADISRMIYGHVSGGVEHGFAPSQG